MDWREAAKEAADDIQHDGFKQGFLELERDYQIDEAELGKLLVVSSLALMAVSIPAAISLQNAQASVENASTDLSSAQAIVSSDSFSSSLENLRQAAGGNLASSVDEISNSVAATEDGIESLEEAETELDEQVEIFQWLSLISILGLVSGLAIIFV